MNLMLVSLLHFKKLSQLTSYNTLIENLRKDRIATTGLNLLQENTWFANQSWMHIQHKQLRPGTSRFTAYNNTFYIFRHTRIHHEQKRNGYKGDNQNTPQQSRKTKEMSVLNHPFTGG